MKLKTHFTKLAYSSIKLAAMASLISASISSTFANPFAPLHKLFCDYPICPHWYVGANLGLSHLHDKVTPNIPGSVDQNGPGGSVDLGYQFTRFWGAELGFTLYHDSRENSGNINIAKTEHYSAYIAATGTIPVVANVSLLAKVGPSYSYANKIYTTFGNSVSSGSVSPYGSLGLSFKITRTVDFLVQYARAWGNDYTGSADLFSLAVQAAIM